MYAVVQQYSSRQVLRSFRLEILQPKIRRRCRRTKKNKAGMSGLTTPSWHFWRTCESCGRSKSLDDFWWSCVILYWWYGRRCFSKIVPMHIEVAHTYIAHTYRLTYIHSYIYTYLHIDLEGYMCVFVEFWDKSMLFALKSRWKAVVEILNWCATKHEGS